MDNIPGVIFSFRIHSFLWIEES